MVTVVPWPRALLSPTVLRPGAQSHAPGRARDRCLCRPPRGEERIEHFRGDVVGNPHTGILHGYRDPSLVLDISRADDHRTSFGHGVTGIDDEVHERRLQLVGVNDDVPDIFRDIDRQRDGAAESAVEHVPERFEPRRQIDGLRLQSLPSGEGQQLAGQRCGALGSAIDRLQGTKRLFARDVLSDGVNAAGNDHQQIVEVVGDAAGELAERIELLRFGELPLHRKQLLLRLLALADVAGDLGKACQLAGVVADGIDDDACPEKRAVLANPPAVLLVMPGFRGDLQRLGRLSRGLVGRGVESRKVLADDLPGRIALDAFAAGVPVRDYAGRIQHVEGIIGDAGRPAS